ncbi:MAG: hypothetical protein V1726_04060 [Methanobacteriota archaeon]
MTKHRFFRNRKSVFPFIPNVSAVVGLPMRLTVSLIIGAVALAAILTYILNPCLFPGKIVVSITPMVYDITANTTLNMSVTVTETSGSPISGATVLVDGLGGAGANTTDIHGKTVIQLSVHLESGQHEGYLDVVVKAACHETFSQNDMIKVIDLS